MILLGIVGPSGAGKTTVCKYFQGFGFRKLHMASQLKHAFCTLFECSLSYTEQPMIEAPQTWLGGVTPRTILEHLGTKLHEIAPQALPMGMEKRMRRFAAGDDRVLIDGIRRITETDMVHRWGGKVIRVAGTQIDPDKPCDISQQEAEHDFLVHFSPTVEELHAQLEVIARTFLPEVFDGNRAAGR